MYRLLPAGRSPGNRLEPKGAWYSFGLSFFPSGESKLFTIGNDFAGPRGHTHGIWSSFSQRYIALNQSFFGSFPSSATGKVKKTRCFTWYRYHSRCVKMNKKRAKKMDAFACYFCQWKVNIILWSDNKSLKKVVILFLTTSKRYYVVRVHTFP